MKIAFLIRDISRIAGQTNDIIDIAIGLHKTHPNWEFSFYALNIYETDFVPEFIRVFQLNRNYSSFIFYRGISKKLRNSDIVYVKGYYPYMIPAKRSGRPTILVVHNEIPPRLFSNSKYDFRTLVANLLTPYMLKMADRAITISYECQDYYRRRYQIETMVIPDQISEDFFVKNARKKTISEERVSLLSVGPWHGPRFHKRQDLLLRVVAKIVEHNQKLRLTLAGIESSNSIKELENLAENLKLKNYVTIKGRLSKEELIKEYLSNDVYVTHTTYEGFYRQIIEAFATGMPALVFDSRTVVDNVSSTATVNHVLKSGGGCLFADSRSFKDSLDDILSDYQSYSAKSLKYSENYSSGVITIMNEELFVTLEKQRSSVE